MVSTIVKPSDYNLDSLTFAPIANNKKKSLQTILLPNYDGGRSPMIQLPAIDLDMYGIPSTCDFYKEDYQRMFLKLPLNQSSPEIKEFTDGFLNKFDEKLASSEFKDTVFSSKKVKYTYQPIVRTVAEEETGNKHPHMKIKLLTEYPTNLIRTVIVEQNDAFSRFLKTDTQTLSDIQKYFRLRTNVRCVIAPIKLWVHQINATEANYGITFKLIKALVKVPPERSVKQIYDEHDVEFLNSDSE